jgi:hypothetical protein
MPEYDFAISSVGVPQVGRVPNKPRHLIYLTPPVGSKSKSPIYFISQERPDINQAGFVSAKGMYCDSSEDVIISTFASILDSCPKESILELIFPSHRVICIRSLVFNANKSKTQVNQER